MKKSLLTVLVIAALGWTVQAQTDITFKINHKLGDTSFDMNTVATNNNGSSFNISRLEYYISEITIVHDGGTETMVEDVYILANVYKGSTFTNVELGSFDVTEVEGIRFHIGVDEAHNHLNPADYPTGHPLAPTSPSMHWGWAGGYRFVAFEGMGGDNLDQSYQLHGLGDDNYFETSVDYTTTAENGAVMIELDADYKRGLENMNLDAGLLIHGDYAEAKQALENFRDFVFQPATTTSVSTVDFSEVNNFGLYPNPTSSGTTHINLSSSKDLTYEISVTDILGKEIKRFRDVPSNTNIEFNLEDKGIYFVSLIKDGQAVINRKLLVH